jgi:hypothetical protein
MLPLIHALLLSFVCNEVTMNHEQNTTHEQRDIEERDRRELEKREGEDKSGEERR